MYSISPIVYGCQTYVTYTATDHRKWTFENQSLPPLLSPLESNSPVCMLSYSNL